MSSTDHASDVPTENDVNDAILALDDDATLAVEQILTMVYRRAKAEARDSTDARVAVLPLRWALCYAEGCADAIRRDRAEEAAKADKVTPADAERLLAEANAEVQQ